MNDINVGTMCYLTTACECPDLVGRVVEIAEIAPAVEVYARTGLPTRILTPGYRCEADWIRRESRLGGWSWWADRASLMPFSDPGTSKDTDYREPVTTEDQRTEATVSVFDKHLERQRQQEFERRAGDEVIRKQGQRSVLELLRLTSGRRPQEGWNAR